VSYSELADSVSVVTEVLHVDPLQDSYRCAPNDIWSLGIMLINLVCGRNPWSEASAAASVFRAYTKDANVLKGILPITDELCDLLARILTVDPEARITLPELRAGIIACSQLSAFTPFYWTSAST
jgi:serine/threonine protein kinase